MSSQSTMAGTTVWAIDPAHTTVEFTAKHMMITKVKGRFVEVQGQVEVDVEHPERSSVQAEIQAASIDTRTEGRDEHLRSADFLDVANYPTITFKSKQVEGASLNAGDEFTVTGDLTIHGTTREVTLDVEYEGKGKDPWGGERASFSANGKIDRRDFGLTWNQALETGGILVGNEIKISIEAQVVKQ